VTSGAIDGTSSAITVTVSQATLSAAVPLPAAGQAVLCENEPMVVTSVTGLTLGLLRGTLPLATLAAHAGAVNLVTLKYPTPWEMMKEEAIVPWFLNIITGLGAKSATLGATAAGAVTQ
jgi:hypothetical protein